MITLMQTVVTKLDRLGCGPRDLVEFLLMQQLGRWAHAFLMYWGQKLDSLKVAVWSSKFNSYIFMWQLL